jgi:Major Facilitator Superfamily/Cyclic nucleotide-binding domain
VSGREATRATAVRTVLRDRRLSRALRGYATFTIGEFGSWLAVLLFAFERGGVGEVGWVAAVMLVPAALLGPFVAGAADWFPRHRVLTIGFALYAASLGATGVAMLFGTPPWLIYGFAVVASVVLMPARPAIASVLPDVATTTDQLTAANVTVGLVETLGQLLGPALAGVVLAFGSPGHVLVVLAVLGLCGAIATVGAVDRDTDDVGHVDDPQRGSTAAQLVAGIRLCIGDSHIRALVATISATGFVVGAIDVGATTLAIGVLGRGETTVSLLGGAFGLGAVLGAAASLMLVGKQRLAPGVFGGATVSCAVFALVGQSSLVILTVLMLVVAGAGLTLTAVGARTMLQGLAPDDTLARLFGVIEALFSASVAVGGIALSFVALRVGDAESFAVVGALGVTVIGFNLSSLLAVDAARRPIDPDVIELARSSPIFGPLPPYAMEQILHGLIRERFEQGATILERGDIGNRMFLVDEGEVVIDVDGVDPVVRGHGAHMGEIAILRDAPRNANVYAGPAGATVYWMDGETFLDAIDRVPRSRARAEAEVDRRIGP